LGRHFAKGVLKVVSSGLLGGAIAALLLWFLASRGLLLPQASPPTLSTSTTPGLDYIDRYACPRGMTKIVEVRGQEDGFARDGDERAFPRAALLRYPFYSDLFNQVSQSVQWRDYDEIGADKMLIDHFMVPTNIVSGQLVLRVKAETGSINDQIIIGNVDDVVREKSPDVASEFRLQGWKADKDGFVKADLADFIPSEDKLRPASIFNYLNKTDRPDEIDLLIQDDTVVDFAALILCQIPNPSKGVTFREFRNKKFGDEISMLSCAHDKTQNICDVYQGNRVCTTQTPLACYKPGSSMPPSALAVASAEARYFANGEVRLTSPVAASRFPSITDANQHCRQAFGEGWRVLSYHEGGGGMVISRSDIAPRSEAWVDIRDQRYANCWDRDKTR
jgi:hypothetical protein